MPKLFENCVFDDPSFGLQMQNFQNLCRTGPAPHNKESIGMPTLHIGSPCEKFYGYYAVPNKRTHPNKRTPSKIL